MFWPPAASSRPVARNWPSSSRPRATPALSRRRLHDRPSRAPAMNVEPTPISSYIRQFAEAKVNLPGSGIGWLEALREEAIDRFGNNGFPTPKVEAWKFTNLGPLARTVFPSVAMQPVSALTNGELAAFRLTPDCHL